jgi:hypothetical protein
MTSVFISYRSEDEAFAAVLLNHALSQRFGSARIFLDTGMPVGIDYRPELWGRLARSTAVLVVIGPRWLTVSDPAGRKVDNEDDFVRREIQMALQTGTRVVPVLVGDTPMPAADDLPTDIRELSTRQFLRLRARNAQYDIQHLVDELLEILEDAPAAALESQPTPDPARGTHRPRAGGGEAGPVRNKFRDTRIENANFGIIYE